MIEGRYRSLEAVMEDPHSTTRDIIDFAGNAQDATDRCNADKGSARAIITEIEP